MGKPPPYLSLAKRIINDPEELERILGLVWQDGYSRGLKDMNFLHEKLDEQ